MADFLLPKSSAAEDATDDYWPSPEEEAGMLAALRTEIGETAHARPSRTTRGDEDRV